MSMRRGGERRRLIEAKSNRIKGRELVGVKLRGNAWNEDVKVRGITWRP